MNNKLCIIPARGGSKRIPRKNIKEFLGKPIIAYSIEAAISSNLFDEVMVSTDDEEIAEIAKQYGAKVPFFRSPENSDDYAITLDVIREVLSVYYEKGLNFNQICCLYPCAPLVEKESLILGYQKLNNQGFDSVVPVVSFSFPIQRAFRIHDNLLQYSQPEFEKKRSQDLEKHYHDVGMFYWFNKSILEKNTLVTFNTGYVELPEIRVQDIDTLMDWKMAEIKYNLINEVS